MIDTFSAHRPDGTNGSVAAAVSADGRARHGERHRVPPRCGVAVRLELGERLAVVNTHGTQVCDLWAFAAEDPTEHLSMAHLHTDLGSILPRAGDRLVSNRRRPMLVLESDSGRGAHDTVVAACDLERYRQLGCAGYHDNCTDNLRMALAAIGFRPTCVPAPLNLWMNTPVREDGSIAWLAPRSCAGDEVVLRAEMSCVAVMSACPQDRTPINGEGRVPTELHFTVTGGPGG